jgi:hypothetical protein
MTVFDFVLGVEGCSNDIIPLLRVCKEWKVRPLAARPHAHVFTFAKQLALPCFWKQLSFSSITRSEDVAADVLVEPGPVAHIVNWTLSLSISTIAPDWEYLNTLCHLLASTRNLREFSMADPQVMTYPQVAPLRLTALNASRLTLCDLWTSHSRALR